MNWQPIETAPKDRPILLHAAYPWAVYGIWNEVSKKWVIANLQCDQFEGAWIDTYFENEHESTDDSRGIPTVTHWMPVPELPAPSGLEERK